MKDIVPLLQTILWIGLIIFLLKRIFPDFSFIRNIIYRRLESGSSLTVGPVSLGSLQNEVQNVKDKLIQLNNNVSSLFLTTMSPAMYSNLKKFRYNNFGKFIKSQGLTRELYHLRDIGYIKVESITAIPENGDDLSQYVTITETGSLFVDLREKTGSEFKENI